MQCFKFSNLFLVLLICAFFVSCTPKNTSGSGSSESSTSTETTSQDNTDTQTKEEAEGEYTFSYKMGSEPQIESKGEGMSVMLSKKDLTKKGEKYYHTALDFHILYENRISFKFSVVDKNVVEKMIGQYPFTETIHFGGGEEQSHMTVMVVDTDGASQPFASKETATADVNFDGKNLKFSIKNATVTGMQDEEVTIPFEFELDAKNVEVTKKGF